MTVYGNTVAPIGDSVSLPVAKEPVEMIINGSEHATVYHLNPKTRPGSQSWGRPLRNAYG